MNRVSIWIDLVKLLGGFAAIWVGYVLLWPMVPDEFKPDWTLDEDLVTISIEDEEGLGDFILEAFEIEQSEDLPAAVDSGLWVIENRLLSQLDATDYEYNFYIVDNPAVNAMTFPGGNIVVFTGLLELSDTPEQVAAVLAHEIGHAEHRHVVDKLITELGITFVMAVITGGDANLIHELTQTVISSVFSRNQEQEADQFSMELLERSQIDPRALAAFFRKMNRENLDYADELEWVMSHPHNNSRIKASLEYEVGEGFESKPIDLDWDAVKAAL